MKTQVRRLVAAMGFGFGLAAFATAVSALPLTIWDFAVYGGGGVSTNATSNPEARIGNGVTVYGNVGSNQDVAITQNAVVQGHVLAGGALDIGSNAQIGSAANPVTVISNLAADLNGTIYGQFHSGSGIAGAGTGVQSMLLQSDAGVVGDVYTKRDLRWNANSAIIVSGNATVGGAHTGSANALPNAAPPGTNKILGTNTTGSTSGLLSWGGVTIPAATAFAAGGGDQTCSGGSCTSLTLAPGTYGDLDIGQDKELRLGSGDYFFDAINVNSGLDLYLDLSSGGTLNLYVVGVANFGSGQDVYVKRPGAGSFVQVSLGTALDKAAASLVYLETHDKFNINQNSEWLGTVFASVVEADGSDETYVGEDINVWGALYAFDSVDVHQDSVVNFVASYRAPQVAAQVPEPTTLLLLGGAMLALARVRRRSADRCRPAPGSAAAH